MSITKGHTFSDGDTLTATKLNNLVDNAGDGAAVFNESGAAVDFRIEGDTDTHMFFVDGSADRISIGASTDAPAAILEVTGDASSAAPVLQVNNLEDTINGVEIVSDSLTTGSALSVKSNSSDTGTRSIAHIHQDHASASGASALKITQDNAAAPAVELASNSIIKLNDNSATALSIDSAGKTGIMTVITTDDNEKVVIGGAALTYSGTAPVLGVTSGAAQTVMVIENTASSSDQDAILVITGNGDATIQLNDKSTSGSNDAIYNISSADGQFHIGAINDNGTSRGGLMTLYPDGGVKFDNLPTSDPASAGKLWSNSGVVTVSGG
jgi:hypothetical protein